MEYRRVFKGVMHVFGKNLNAAQEEISPRTHDIIKHKVPVFPAGNLGGFPRERSAAAKVALLMQP